MSARRNRCGTRASGCRTWLPPLGIMVEVPAAALNADGLAVVADFFAIGSNDLTMYTLASDRAGTEAGAIYNATHPAVLRLIAMAVAAGARHGTDVSLCGEMAANPRLAPLLLGLGLRNFSMNATAVPRVKQAVRALQLEACQAFAAAVLAEFEPEGVAARIQAFHEPKTRG